MALDDTSVTGLFFFFSYSFTLSPSGSILFMAGTCIELPVYSPLQTEITSHCTPSSRVIEAAKQRELESWEEPS